MAAAVLVAGYPTAGPVPARKASPTANGCGDGGCNYDAFRDPLAAMIRLCEESCTPRPIHPRLLLSVCEQYCHCRRGLQREAKRWHRDKRRSVAR